MYNHNPNNTNKRPFQIIYLLFSKKRRAFHNEPTCTQVWRMFEEIHADLLFGLFLCIRPLTTVCNTTQHRTNRLRITTPAPKSPWPFLGETCSLLHQVGLSMLIWPTRTLLPPLPLRSSLISYSSSGASPAVNRIPAKASSSAPPSASIYSMYSTPAKLDVQEGAYATKTPARSDLFASSDLKEKATVDLSGADSTDSSSGDERWVTVFGFSPSFTSVVLSIFHNYGQIIRVKHARDQGNWIHILCVVFLLGRTFSLLNAHWGADTKLNYKLKRHWVKVDRLSVVIWW